jgi:uncharacterized protein (TIGR02001 family)
MTTKTLHRLIALAALGLSAGQAFAEASPVSFNVGAVSEYRYRGLAQSSFKPAVQGGVDYAAPSGAYLGVWGSTIDWIKDDGKSHGGGATTDTGSTNLEIDLYGGFKGATDSGTGYDVGVLTYYYPGNKYSNLGANANTTEVYGALTIGVLTAKYSHSLTNLFGVKNSKGSGYLDLSATFDLGNGFSFTPHVGRQTLAGTVDGASNSVYSYTDVSLTLGKDLGNGLSASAMAVGTTNQSNWLSSDQHSAKSKGKSAVVLGLKYAF